MHLVFFGAIISKMKCPFCNHALNWYQGEQFCDHCKYNTVPTDKNLPQIEATYNGYVWYTIDGEHELMIGFGKVHRRRYSYD